MTDRRLHSIVLILGLVWSVPASPEEKSMRTFHVKDYGAVPDGKTDSGDAIRSAIQAAKSSGPGAEVVLEAGEYRVTGAKRRQQAFPVKDAEGLTIRGAGNATRIVIADPTAGGFNVSGSKGIVLRDFVVDYDPVPFTQGRIQAVDREKGTFDLKIASGYPSPDGENFMTAIEPYGKWGMIVDPATRRIKMGTPDCYMTPRWEKAGDGVWRFHVMEGYHKNNLAVMNAGDSYVHLARGHAGSVLGFVASEDGLIENVTVNSSPGLAVVLQSNTGVITVRGLEVRFPEKSDRLLTTTADGVHCQQNRVGPVIENCYFEGMADDAVNIYAPPNLLREARSATEWVVTKGCKLREGDRLQVIDPISGSIRAETKAARVVEEKDRYILTLADPVEGAVAGEDAKKVDTVYDLDACGAGYVIRNNHMNGNRRYGCLLRAGDGLVENNKFEDTTGAGVVLTNEPDWPEGPMPWNITVRNNVFLRGGTCRGYAEGNFGGAMLVRGTKLGHGIANGRGIHDIKIENNQFIDRAGAAIQVAGAKNVTISKNTIKAADDAVSMRKTGAIVLMDCKGIALKNNRVEDRRPMTTSAVEIDSTVERDGVNGAETTEAKLIEGTNPLDDRRGK